jgi:hypothetical protein
MLLRCATGMMRGPLGLAAGLAFAGGIAAGVAIGAGAAGAAMLGKRMWEERKGWRSGAADDAPPAEPADAPLT